MRTPSNLMVGLESVFDVTAVGIGRVGVIITVILVLGGYETIYACWSQMGPKQVLEKSVREVQGHFCEKRVSHNDHHGRQYSRLSGGPADSLRAAANGEPFVTANGGKDEREKKRLSESLHQVCKIQSIDRAAPELDRSEAQREN